MKTIALSGGIASGKSTVAGWFKEKGVPVISADESSRRVVEPDQPAYRAILNRFGPEILDASKKIHRPSLAHLIRHNDQARQDLNHIIHPPIVADMNEQIQALDSSLVVLEIPLLFEGDRVMDFDDILLVYCSPDQQVQRLMKREGLSQKEARLWLGTQMSIDEKRGKADLIIDNSGHHQEARQQFDALWSDRYDSLWDASTNHS